MKTLQEQVGLLWDSYWKNFNDAEQQSRRSGESHLGAKRARREFAERSIKDFVRLEHGFVDRVADSTTLLFYKVGFMLYGDAEDDRSALKYLRSILCCAPLEKNLVNEQIFAVQMTLRVYGQNQEELARTLSLIDVRGMSAHDLKQLREAVFTAVTSEFKDLSARINDLLYEELNRVCGLGVENEEHPSFGYFVDAYRGSYG